MQSNFNTYGPPFAQQQRQQQSQQQQSQSRPPYQQSYNRNSYQKILGNNYSSILNPDFDDGDDNSDPDSPLEQSRPKAFHNKFNYKFGQQQQQQPYYNPMSQQQKPQLGRPRYYQQPPTSQLYDSSFDGYATGGVLPPFSTDYRFNNYHLGIGDDSFDSDDSDSIDDDEKSTEELMVYSPRKYVSPCRIFIGNIPFHSTYESILSFMNSSSMIHLQQLILKVQHNGISKGFAIGLTNSLEESVELIKQFNGVKFEGRRLIVRFDKLPRLIMRSHNLKKRKNEEMMMLKEVEQAKRDAEQAGVITNLSVNGPDVPKTAVSDLGDVSFTSSLTSRSDNTGIVSNDDVTTLGKSINGDTKTTSSNGSIHDIQKEKEVARELVNVISNSKAK
ncbi:unnamed protein product [Ambrosiozyma monospora]|uniref:Unnamed protein product n=1 Tax=Ambrosiozyma monospora TaxID=43982 RepID=A0A9W6Z8C5_AMBMO|nr:unnamed protein product [Ambrosiozyma monospora]